VRRPPWLVPGTPCLGALLLTKAGLANEIPDFAERKIAPDSTGCQNGRPVLLRGIEPDQCRSQCLLAEDRSARLLKRRWKVPGTPSPPRCATRQIRSVAFLSRSNHRQGRSPDCKPATEGSEGAAMSPGSAMVVGNWPSAALSSTRLEVLM
jgi:hypothetical protein